MRDLKETGRDIFLSMLDRIDVARIVKERIRLAGKTLSVDGVSLDLSEFREVVLVGIGKASVSIGAALEDVLGDHINRGVLVSDRCPAKAMRSEVIVGGHPLPNAGSLEGGRRILELVGGCGSDTLIIFIISGGGSALAEVPLTDDITLEDLRELNRLLIHSGATIRDINIVRKHVSRLKGGRLGHLARGSSSVALYLSDVNTGDLMSIASNPLLEDDASLGDFFRVVADVGEYNFPASVRRAIKQVSPLPAGWGGAGGRHISMLLLENKDALKTAAALAVERGLVAVVDEERVEGPYERVADELIYEALDLASKYPDETFCLISGGEVSCRVRGDGLGGRNQEFVMYCASRLADLGPQVDIAVLSCGTDGVDGNSGAAGAAADASTVVNARQAGLDYERYLKANDSNSFFQQVGGLIVTGPTGNNVRDVRFLLLRGKEAQ